MNQRKRVLWHESRYLSAWSFDRARFNGFPLILATLSKVEDDEGGSSKGWTREDDRTWDGCCLAECGGDRNENESEEEKEMGRRNDEKEKKELGLGVEEQ